MALHAEGRNAMTFWLGFVIGLVVGAFLGIWAMAMCAMAGRGER